MSKIIGIDLGTSNSCVYVCEGSNRTCITNSNGSRTTPSVVALNEKERLVGNSAKNQAVTNAEKTIYGIKRLIGRKFSEKNVQEWKEVVPYKVVEGSNGDACIEVNGKKYTPIEISSYILAQLKKDAENYLGEEVKQAIITVPAYFNDKQRQATKDAGTIAGLEVLRIINEPTSASLAYSLDKEKNEKVAVFDWGGGTMDFSILEIGDGIIEVLSTSGNSTLGGEDIDAILIKWMIDSFKEKEGIDLSNDNMALQRIKEAAENAKKELSTSLETSINLPFITANQSGPKHLITSLTRGKFEAMIEEIVNKTFEPCKIALKDAGLSVSDISEVILVGGSTRIPLIQNRVKEFFGKEPNKSVNPDEVVAMGASVQGSILSGEKKDILLLDVIPISLGLRVNGDVFEKIIEKNTTIPTKKSQVFTTASDNQPAVSIQIYQGERRFVKDCTMIGTFDLISIPPAPRGVPQIEVTFDVDANSILHVTAKDKGTGKEQHIEIKNDSGLSKEEIERLSREAEMYKDEDEKKFKIVETKNKADNLIYATRKSMKDLGDKIDSSIKDEIEKKITELENVKENDDISLIEQKCDELQQAAYKIAEKLYQNNNQTETNQKKDDNVMDADFTEV